MRLRAAACPLPRTACSCSTLSATRAAGRRRPLPALSIVAGAGGGKDLASAPCRSSDRFGSGGEWEYQEGVQT